MTLREVAFDHGVKRKDTCKLYFGLYPYSLTTPVPRDLIEEKATATANYNRVSEQRRVLSGRYYQMGQKPPRFPAIKPSMCQIRRDYQDGVDEVVADLVDRNRDIFGADDYYHSFNNANITFYVKHEDTAIRLLKNNIGIFTTVSEPYSEEVAQFLESCAQNRSRVIVRERLFMDEYEYRIDFRWQPDQSYADLDARVTRMIFRKCDYSYGVYRKLYLNGDDDLILARIGLEDCIDGITKCVLRSNVPPS